jgi:hypothetical protein
VTGEEIGPRLRAALVHGWEGFTFRLTGLEQVRDTAALRGDVKVSYQGDPWSTVQFEVSPAEGSSGQQIHWTTNTFVDPEHLGLRSPGELPLVTIAYLVAQKLHACTASRESTRPAPQFEPQRHASRHNKKTEGEGFEPSDQGLPGQQLSRLPHSTALPPLQDDAT